MYPKLSIDVSRSVRMLAHKIQGRLGTVLGKRFGKYFKYGVGPWIFGLFDTDRIVSTSAQQSLKAVLPSSLFDESGNASDALYLKFRDPLLDFIFNVIAHETVESLSDERYVSKEEAEIKYFRTVRSAAATLSILISKTEPPAPDSKAEQKLLQVLEEDKLWKMAYSNDVALSKTVLNLISTIFSKAPKRWADAIKDKVATALISKGLSSSSSLVSVDFIQALNNLSRFDPESWNSVSSKKSPLTRLASFISKGNKGRAEHFWPSILALLSLLPPSVSPYAYDANEENTARNSDVITSAFLEAVLREPSAQAHHAWGYYMAVVEKIIIASNGANVSCISALYDAIQMTFFSSESKPLEDDIIFKVIGKKTSDLAKVAPNVVQSKVEAILDSIDIQQPTGGSINILHFIKYTAENMKKAGIELDISATGVVSKVVEALRTEPEEPTKGLFALKSLTILGKDLIMDASVNDSYVALVELFFTSYVTLGKQELLLKITASFVIASQNTSSFHEALDIAQENIKSFDHSSNSVALLSNFLSLSSSFSGTLSPSRSFSDFVKKYASSSYKDISSSSVRKLLQAAILAHDVFVTDEDSNSLINLLIDSVLREDESQGTALSILFSLAKKDEKFLYSHFQTTEGKALVGQLWKVSENNEQKSDIDALLAQLEAFAVSNNSGAGDGVKSLASDIIAELRTGPLEEVIHLVQRAERLINTSTDSGEKHQVFEFLLLDKANWDEQIQYSLDQGLSPSLAISSSFGNSIYLTSFEEVVKKPTVLLTSPALVNMAVFTTSLIHRFPDIYKDISHEVSVTLLSSLAYTSEIIDIAIAQFEKHESSDPFYHDLQDLAPVLTADIRAILSEIFASLVGKPDIYLTGLTDPLATSSISSSLLVDAWNGCLSLDAKAFYSSRVLETYFSLVGAGQGHKSIDLFKKVLNKFERNALGCYALLNSLKHTKVIDELSYLRNNLFGGLVTIPKLQLATKGLKYFVLFISSLQLQDSSKAGLTFFKLMNFVRTLDSIIQSDEAFDEANAPLLALTAQFYEVIGDHFLSELSLSFWEQFTNIFEPSVVVLSLEPTFHDALLVAILNLFNKLLTLNGSKLGGEDLSACMEATSPKIFDLYVEVLSGVEPAHTQLEEAKSEALLNALSKLPAGTEFDAEIPYRLLRFEDKYLQILSLVLLKTAMTANEKEKSLSFALLKQPIDMGSADVEPFLLPSKLLSLVSKKPVDSNKAQLRQFLYSWIALFFFFETSVSSLRNFYLSQLKEGSYVEHLLNYVAKEIEAGLEKDSATLWRIESLDPSVDLNNAYDIDRATWNLYYQTLNNAGPLAKAWFLDIKNNKIRTDIENFTKKHISPLVIERKAEVIRKVLEQGNDLVDDTLDIQISKSGKVVTAYYFIDTQTMEVAFHYPDTYPLKDIYLEGVQLVGVREKQWRAWILASQSVLKSTGGSLLDSLDLFKRNVTMHFDGVAACAICYSILHEDHTLPSKECGTCHNRFHTDCLYRWFKSGSTESCPLCRSDSFRIGH